MASEEKNSKLRLKFRGSMMGALMGDCLGGPFEFRETPIATEELGIFFTNLLSKDSKKIFEYSDDTCMTLSVASSLVENKMVASKDMAKRFVEEYYHDQSRGYGDHVVHVFKALKDTNFKDVFLPAKEQFNGTGSYGNGAAMRISPIALAGYHKMDEEIKKDVEECSYVTHTHPNGYNGAILQCFAVHSALKLDPQQELDPIQFINQLETKLKSIQLQEDSPYYKSLQDIKDIFVKGQEYTPQQIADILGNAVSAQRSVPTAIYSFLRGMKPIPDFECDNPFVRTLYFAIAVGGDSDTIGSMACSIAGAYHGAESVPEALQKRCEAIDDVCQLAERLYETFKA